MKYQEGFFGSRSDFAEFIKKIIPDLFSKRLVVEGQSVVLPTDRDLEYKIKYDVDDDGGSFTLKVSWENEVAGDDDVEVEVDAD